MKRPLEKGDVAEDLEEPAGLRITLQTPAALGQQNEGKVRPLGLLV